MNHNVECLWYIFAIVELGNHSLHIFLYFNVSQNNVCHMDLKQYFLDGIFFDKY